MSSRPEIAPGAPAAAATGPGCHSEEAQSPKPEGPLPTPSLRKARVFPADCTSYFTFRRLGGGRGEEPRGGGPEGVGTGGGRAPPYTGLCFCPYKVWAAVGEGPGPRLRPVPPSLLGARAAGTSQSGLALLARHPCARSAQPAPLVLPALPAGRPAPHRSHGRDQEEDADAKAGQGECHRPCGAGRGRQEAG